MRRNPDFMLREVAGKQVVVPVGQAAAGFPGMLTMNDTGAYLWQLLEQEQTAQALAAALTDKYEVTPEKALEDVQTFIQKLIPVNAIIEE